MADDGCVLDLFYRNIVKKLTFSMLGKNQQTAF